MSQKVEYSSPKLTLPSREASWSLEGGGAGPGLVGARTVAGDRGVCASLAGGNCVWGSNPHEMIATLKLPKTLSQDELLLELGPDRLLLQSDMYLLDIFLPFNIYPEQSRAEFHRDERHLKVQMKVSKNLL